MDPALTALKRFGDRLRAERERRGFSQEHLGDRAGLDRTYVSGIERGIRNVGLRNIERLAETLEVPPSSLLAEAAVAGPARGGERAGLGEVAFAINPAATIDCGFLVSIRDVTSAVQQTNVVLSRLPLTLFQTIDLKTQSGIVGAVFAAELAAAVAAIPNPIEKGHPDIVPASAAGASEASLRNYPAGLEIKSTLGSVAKGSGLRAGEARVTALVNVVWQAHHRDVRALMALIWDFVGGSKSDPSHPAITAVFYSDELLEDDWGKISGTTGRNTKVTGMKVSGRRKMAVGAFAVLAERPYLETYARCLGVSGFAALTRECE